MNGESASGKPAGFGPAIRGFESFLPSHFFSFGHRVEDLLRGISEAVSHHGSHDDRADAN